MLKIRLNRAEYDTIEEQYRITYTIKGVNIKFTANFTPNNTDMFDLSEIFDFLSKLHKVDKEDLQVIYKNYCFQNNKCIKLY